MTATSWNLNNAQRELQARRPPPTIRPVTAGRIMQALRAPIGGEPSPIVTQTKPPIGLGDLRTDHLSTELTVSLPGRDKPLRVHERQIFTEAVAAAQNWIRRRQEKPGLSFVLVAGDLPETCRVTDHAGSVVNAKFDGYGCGKTTIARAMFASCQQIATPLAEWRPPTPSSLRYLAERLSISEEEALSRLEVARRECGRDNPAQVLPGGVWLTAPELMGHMDDKEFSVHRLIGSPETTKVVVLDDVGREGELRFSKRDDDPQLREKQARYYRIVNYCYELYQEGTGISLIVTSNLRLNILEEFLGAASWSRLLQMSPNGFMRDMTGVRNYRPYIRGE